MKGGKTKTEKRGRGSEDEDEEERGSGDEGDAVSPPEGATKLTGTKSFYVAQNLPVLMKTEKLDETAAKKALSERWQSMKREEMLNWEAMRKTAKRDNFPERVRYALRDESGSFCARCGEETVLRDDESVINFGEAAHIVAASVNGPRGKDKPPDWTSDDIKSQNGVWLCPPCHKLVDCDQFTVKFPVRVLKEFKTKARQAAIERATQQESFRGLDWSDFASVAAAVVRSRPDQPAPTFCVEGGQLGPGEKPALGAGLVEGSASFDVRAPRKK